MAITMEVLKEYQIEKILLNKGEYSKDKVIMQLENPETIELNDKGCMVCVLLDEGIEHFSSMRQYIKRLYDDDRSLISSEPVYFASPIMMALLMERYDLVEPLLETGFSLICKDFGVTEEKVTIIINGCIRYVSLGQFIMGDPHMPDSLRILFWKKLQDIKLQFNNDNEVICFDDFIFIQPFDVGLDLFNRDNDNQVCKYQGTILKTMSFFAEEIPQYADTLKLSNWINWLKNKDISFLMDLLKVLFDKILHTNDQKKVFLGWIESPLMNSDFPQAVDVKDVNIYSYIQQYYQDSIDLQQAFFNSLLKCYWHSVWLNDEFNIILGSTPLKELIKLIKKVIPEKYSFDDFTNGIFDDSNHYPIIDLNKICWCFKQISNESICIYDDSLIGKYNVKSAEEQFRANSLLGNGWTYMTPPEPDVDCKDYEWMSLVDEFSFDEARPLNNIQKHFLEQGEQDTMIIAMEKGMLKDKHIDKAITYCMCNKGCSEMIPCLVAFME